MPRFWLWLVLVYGLLVLILAWQFKVSHDRTVGRAVEHADNLAQIIDSQFTGSLRRVEVSLRQIAARLPRSALDRDVAASHRAEVDAVLQPYRESFPELLNFFVWDRAGRILYTTASMQNNAYTRGSTARHMGYRELRDNPKATIAFSNLIRGYTTGRMTLAMYVPIRDAQGQLFAVVSASINVEVFQETFAGMNLSPNSLIFVRNSQTHRLMMRYPVTADRNYNQPVNSRTQQRIDAGETRGRDRYNALTDGEPRLYAFRKLKGYPFYVAVGMSEKDALQGWRGEAVFVLSIALLLGVLLFVVLWRMRKVEKERAQALKRADDATGLLHSAINNISVGIAVYDEHDRQMIVNKAMREMYEPRINFDKPGATFEDLIRAGLQQGLFPEAVGREEEWLAERMAQRRQAVSGVGQEVQLDDGRWVLYTEHMTPQGYRVGTRIDITERKRMENELREQATTDMLTGLPNRRRFMQRLAEEFERVRRHEMPPASVLMLDLDFFKRVNDQYGHAAGDAVLKHFAALLTRELRATDMAGRLGGEEFAVILPGSDVNAARGWALRLSKALVDQPLMWSEDDVPEGQQISLAVTVSVGITALHAQGNVHDNVGPEAALSQADAALYKAKENGRNRVEVWTA